MFGFPRPPGWRHVAMTADGWCVSTRLFVCVLTEVKGSLLSYLNNLAITLAMKVMLLLRGYDDGTRRGTVLARTLRPRSMRALEEAGRSAPRFFVRLLRGGSDDRSFYDTSSLGRL